MGSWTQSASAYEKALSLLPEECSAPETTLKKQCEAGLEAVRETLNRLATQKDDSFIRVPIDQVKTYELPWSRAVTMMDELVSAENPDSSVCVFFLLDSRTSGDGLNSSRLGMGYHERSQSILSIF